MKRTLLRTGLLMAVLVMGSGISSTWSLFAQTYNAPDSEYWQKVEVEVDDRLSFYDAAGPDAVFEGEKTVMVHFVPKTAGPLTINFSKFSAPGYSGAKIYLYDGEVDWGEEEDYWGEVETTIPSNPQVTIKDGSELTSFTATNARGSITVVIEPEGNIDFEATVTEPAKGPMAFESLRVKNPTSTVTIGQRDAVLIDFDVVTKGTDNPLTLKGVKVKGLNNSFTNLKIRIGDQPSEAFDPVAGGIFASKTLRSGTNRVVITGDVATTVASETIAELTITDLVFNASEQPLKENNSSTLTLKHEAVMVTPSSTIVVKEPLHFYDDGGKEGKISLNFEGSTTFIPADPGKKVVIEFTSLNLFNTSSVGKNDLLEVYSGTQIKAENLLATFLKELGTVYSTSEDGSLTIRLKSIAAYPKDGFEARVRIEEAKPMTFKEVVLNPITLKSPLSAISKDAKVAILSIGTNFSEPALKLSSLKFEVSGVIKEIALFNESGLTELGRQKVNEGASSVQVSLPVAVALSQSDNKFVLAISIDEKSTTGASYNLKLKEVSVEGGASYVPEDSAEVIGKTENTVVATLGTQQVTLYSPWNFTHEKKQYGNGYDNTTGKRVVTFTAPEKDQVIGIDFSTFALNYPSWSSNKPIFKIVDGKDPSGTVIWEVKDASSAAAGPEDKLFSTGNVLTILFDVNNTYSGDGFNATVTAQDAPRAGIREIKQEELGQGTFSLLSSDEVEIAGLSIHAMPQTPAKYIQSIELTVTGKLNLVSLYKLYQIKSDGSRVLFAEIPASTNGNLKFTPKSGTSFEIRDQKTEFILIAVANNTNSEGGEIEYCFTKVTLNDEDPFEVAAPSEPIIKHFRVIVLQHTSGDSKTYTVPQNSSFLYTDEGGPDGPLQSEAYESVITFLPDQAGSIVFLDIKSMDIGYNTTFSIYSGKEVKEDREIAEFNRKAPKEFYWGKLEDGGSITIKVKKKSTTLKNEGWNINVTSKVPSSREIISSIPTGRDSYEVNFGSTNIPAIDFEFMVEGESGGVKLPQIEVTAPKAAAVYLAYAGEENLYNTALPSVLGKKVEGSDKFILQDETLREVNGKVYAFIAVDMPTSGNTGDAVVVTLDKIGDNAYTDVSTTLTLKEGLKGEYTVGSDDSDDYKDLASLENALKGGVSGPVIIRFSSGTYEGNLNIVNIPGASENNPITFTGKTGKAEDVIIRNDPKASSMGYSAPKGLVIVDATPYVTFDGITIKITEKVADDALFVTNASHHFTLRNCVILSQQEEPSQYNNRYGGVCFSGGENNYTQSDFALIEGNRFEGGDIALEMGHIKNVAFENAKGYIVRNNTFKNSYNKSIYTSSLIKDLLIEGNTLTSTMVPKDDAEIWAIDLQLSAANEKIIGNRLYSEHHPRIVGFHLRKAYGSKKLDGTTLIANNSIVITNPSAASNFRYTGVKGIGLSDEGLENLSIVYNTIRMEVGETTSEVSGSDNFAIPIDLMQGTNILVKNNLFYTSRKGVVVARRGTTSPTISHNAYYSPGEKPFFYQYQGQDDKLQSVECDFETWKKQQNDTESIFLKPEFMDAESGALNNGSLFTIGEPFEGVDSDIAGFTRHAATPTVGAYETVEDMDKELLVKEAKIVKKSAAEATVSFTVERSAKLFYQVVKASEAAPDSAALLNTEPITCIVGEKKELTFENLQPATEYKLYGLLEALSQPSQKSGVLEIISFTTELLPTAAATFDNVADYVAGEPFEDGTMKFVGFTIEKAQADGVAVRADGISGEISLTNAGEGITLKSMLIRGKGEVTLTTDRGASRILKLEDTEDFVLVGLESLGLMKQLNISGGQNVAIDNFGADLETPDMASLDVFMVSEGESVVPEIYSLYFAVPYKVVLNYSGGEETLEEVWTNTASLPALRPTATEECRVKIIDDLGRTLSGAFFIVVNPEDGQAKMASFEEPEMDEGLQCRKTRSFYSGSFFFKNSYMPDWNSWSGFAVSRSKETDVDAGRLAETQFNVPSGHGANDSEAFAIFFKSYQDDDLVTIVDPLIAQPVSGMWVSITSYTLKHVEEGDSFYPDGFKDGNYYQVIVTADNGKSVTIPVADYRDGKKSVLKEWTWVSFRELGNVKSLKLTVEGNANNDYGLATPTYLAMDEINGPVPEGVESAIRSENVQIALLGNLLRVRHAEGVLVTLYDLSGQVVRQFTPSSDDYSYELDLPQGTYVVVAAGERVKIAL